MPTRSMNESPDRNRANDKRLLADGRSAWRWITASRILTPLALCACVIPGSASALVGGSVQEMAYGYYQPIYSYSEATRIQVTQSTTPFSGATFFADSDTSVLRLYAKGLYSGGNFGGVRTTVGMYDDLSFHGYSSGQIGRLYYSVDGSFQPTGEPQPGFATGWGLYQAKVYDGTQNYLHSVGFAANEGLTSYGCFGTTECLVGQTPPRVTGVIEFPLTGANYTFNLFIQMNVYGGYIADFSSTARAYLSLPAGVTYESGSGGFLTLATPISLVPEPGTPALWMTGLGLAVGIVRRRRMSAI